MNSIDKKINKFFDIIDLNPNLTNKEAIDLYKNNLNDIDNNKKSDLIYIISATYWILGDYKNAMKYAQKNISNNYSIIGTINAYKILGNITADLNNYLNSIDYYNNGLQLAIDNNISKEYYAFYSNIGIIYNEIGDYKNAIEFNLKAIKCENSSSSVNIAAAEINLIEPYINIKDFDSALKYLKIAKKLISKSETNFANADINSAYSKYYFAKKEYKIALKHCYLSIKFSEIADNKYRNIENYILIGDIYSILKNNIFALENYKKGYDIANEFKDYIQISKISSKLTQLYTEINDSVNVLKYYQSYYKATTEKNLVNTKNIKEQIIIKEKIKSIELERKIILKENIELTKINKKIELINNIGKEITLYTDFKRSSYKINALLKKVLNIDYLIISHINSDQNSLKYIELTNINNTKIKIASDNTSIEDTLAIWVIKNNKPIFNNNYKHDYKKYKKNLRASSKDSPNSVIFIPLKIKNKTIGFFSIQSFKKNAYTKDDFDFINTLSPFISISLENSIKSAKLIDEIKNSQKTKKQLEKANKQLKQYNDNYGHIQGDHCLRKLSLILQSSLKRKSDFIARYGGDEFVAILPNTDINGAIKIIEDITSTLKNNSIVHKYSKVSNQITLSIGGFTTSGYIKINPRTLIKKADECLYYVKNQGRNGFHIKYNDKTKSDI